MDELLATNRPASEGWECEVMNEFNFVRNIEEKDKDLFFGPLKNEDVFIEIQDNWTMANIVVYTENFTSLSQARKNGFNKEIPFGFTDIFVGKKRKRITILDWKKVKPCHITYHKGKIL